MLMNLPFPLPDWMPSWLLLLLALPVLMYLLAFMLMPFSVFGVKARIEAMEAQIDSLHDEVRLLAFRAYGAPQGGRETNNYDEVPNFGRLKKFQQAASEPVSSYSGYRTGARPGADMPRPPLRRVEPRID